MKGIHRIIIQNKRIRYDFELRRNLTVIRGDSATGKTTLIDLIQERIDNGPDSSIDLQCDKTCYVLTGITWKGQLSEMKDSIVFIDEGNHFVSSDEFSRAIRKTDNYYVIISREALPNLPYSVEEIYGIRESRHYAGLKQCYNEFFHIYGAMKQNQKLRPDCLITEDSNAGFQFFREITSENDIKCLSAEGKSNLLSFIRNISKEEGKILCVADGAAFGPEMDRIAKFIQEHKNVHIYLPESFEWLILAANPMNDGDVQAILTEPYAFIESAEYFSWERFFTDLLISKTKGTYLQYSKSKINPSYLKGTVKESVLKKMDHIRLK